MQIVLPWKYVLMIEKHTTMLGFVHNGIKFYTETEEVGVYNIMSFNITNYINSLLIVPIFFERT